MHKRSRRVAEKRLGLRRAVLEALEPRQLLSAVPTVNPRPPAILAQPTFRYALRKSGTLTPYASSGPSGTTPAQMRHFYSVDSLNFNGVTGDGSGQTIAIIDAYGAPTVVNDLHTFDARFGLPDPVLQLMDQNGGSNLPAPQAAGGQDWNVETSLDVQWAHVIAPKAKILLVECTSNNTGYLYQGAMTAAHQPGVVSVSMSFGSGEYSGESGSDSTFVTPVGHGGVAFLASTGDGGSPGSYPAYSPNVIAVGGTTITLGSGGSYGSERGWGSSGGGLSAGYEPEPTYQRSVQNTGHRSTPDVSMDADPGTGVPVFDSYDYPSTSGASWIQLGGTSLSAPMWAGIIALADQARSAVLGLPSLDGATGILPRLYALSTADFHDVVGGSNGSFSAITGYDEVTGLGTPVGNLLVRDLAGLAAPAPPNDNIANAVSLTREITSISGTNVGATREAGEPLNTPNSAGDSIWYSWTAPANAGQVILNTAGSRFDTTLGVYTGTSATDLVQVAANDNDPSQPASVTSRATFTAVPGTRYLISIDGSTASSVQTGATLLTLSAAPANDDFASATVLSGTTATDTGFNFNATAEAGEPNPVGASGEKSVWWNWTAPDGVGTATVDTRGSDFPNTLGVYTGDSPDALTSVADTQSDLANTSLVTFTPIPGTTYHIMVNGVYNTGSGAADQGHITLDVSSAPLPVASVVGRYLFYNNSVFDGFDTSAGPADDTAIAPDKLALLPGVPATFANYSSFSKGINGLMVDVSGLPSGANVSAADFTFRVGTSADPPTWAAAPTPAVVIDRPGAGVFGSDRIEVVWNDNAIQNEWLQVTVKADAMTGLPLPDVFYFGNAIGESGNSIVDAIVDSSDELGARNDPHSFLNPADITNVHDYNRDGRVDAIDQLIARNNATDANTALNLWTPPASPAVAPRAAALPQASGQDPAKLLKRRHSLRRER